MSAAISKQASYDTTSYPVSLSDYDTNGLCANFPLRRHKWESEANAGSYQARLDWIKHIGPIDEFGGYNPINGNFSATALPLTKPERIHAIAYLIECMEAARSYIMLQHDDDPFLCSSANHIIDAFLYDTFIELEQPDTEDHHDRIDLPKQERNTNSALGRARIQAHIMKRLIEIDQDCAEKLKHRFKEYSALTIRDKDKQFGSFEEYMEFRIIDSAAVFMEAVVLFGLGVTLTKEEEAQLASVRRSCFIAQALANDYLSFDREYREFLETGASETLINAVWIHMKLHQVDVDTAKRMVRDITRQNETQFLEHCAQFRRENNPLAERLDRYLDAMAYETSGNVVWSLNCPRYCPETRYDPNAGVEDEMTKTWMRNTLGMDYKVRVVHRASDDPDQHPIMGSEASNGHYRKVSTETCRTTSGDSSSTTDRKTSPASSTSSFSNPEIEQMSSTHTPKSGLLNPEHAKAPFDYINSLPSGGARESFINALTVWLEVPEPAVQRVKSISSRLHSASLLLDDIEDGSSHRRGYPAAHTVFGPAQTINSGCYEILKAVEEAQQLGTKAVKIVLEELEELHIGQSYDLYWTQHNSCPSEDEYLSMAAKKTGGLFRLIARLLLDSTETDASNTRLTTGIDNLVSLIGIQYQIRDDYNNLYCQSYHEQRGFCQDLDEGKFSFPLIHALSVHTDGTKLLLELLQRRKDAGGLSSEHKKLVMKQLDRAGSMSYTMETLRRLQCEVYEGMKRIEEITNKENWIMRSLLRRLEI